MDPRHEQILREIVETYIRTSEPVGSKALADDSRLELSPATIRNVMMDLEADGFLRSPHTSAGRVPTEAAYAYYLKHFVEPQRSATREEKIRQHVRVVRSTEDRMKELAKTLVELSGEMAFAALSPDWTYYTGVSNLFAKPDYDAEQMRVLSTMFDRYDVLMRQLFNLVEDGSTVLIGSQSPFGTETTTVLVKYRLPDRRMGVMGLLGPLRMAYGRNLGLVHEACEVLQNTK